MTDFDMGIVVMLSIWAIASIVQTVRVQNAMERKLEQDMDDFMAEEREWRRFNGL